MCYLVCPSAEFKDRGQIDRPLVLENTELIQWGQRYIWNHCLPGWALTAATSWVLEFQSLIWVPSLIASWFTGEDGPLESWLPTLWLIFLIGWAFHPLVRMKCNVCEAKTALCLGLLHLAPATCSSCPCHPTFLGLSFPVKELSRHCGVSSRSHLWSG